MTKSSPIIRLVLALWVLSSQIAGAALVFGPVVVLLGFSPVADSVPGMNFLMFLGYVLPVVFIGLGIAAWVMFAKRRDALAGWLGAATLLPGAILLLAMQMV